MIMKEPEAQINHTVAYEKDSKRVGIVSTSLEWRRSTGISSGVEEEYWDSALDCVLLERLHSACSSLVSKVNRAADTRSTCWLWYAWLS